MWQSFIWRHWSIKNKNNANEHSPFFKRDYSRIKRDKLLLRLSNKIQNLIISILYKKKKKKFYARIDKLTVLKNDNNCIRQNKKKIATLGGTRKAVLREHLQKRKKFRSNKLTEAAMSTAGENNNSFIMKKTTASLQCVINFKF